MNARLIKIWQDLKSSYYFIPSVMAVAAFLLAMLTTYIDRNFDYTILRKLGWLYSNKADSARSILSTIAGSMITVAGVTFSMTMVAVSSAAAQYGPRLIGNFMRDKANQFTLGTFIATFVYCLIILRVARTGDAGDAQDRIQELVPNFSLLVALVLALASVAVLIFFIHHIPETLNVGNITSKVGRELRSEIKDMFPQEIGESETQKSVNEEDYNLRKSQEVRASAEGYLQAVNNDALLKVAKKNDAVIRLQYRPGDFVIKGNVLVNVWAKSEIDEDTRDDLQGCFAMGRERTVYQNVLFLADELVEILARALSPGINDPFTAINCMNWYHSAVSTMCAGRQPSPYRFDEDKNLRLIAHPISFERFAGVLFGQSRPYVASDRNATLHLITVITECAVEANTPHQRDVLIHHLERLKDAAIDMLASKADQEDVEARYTEARKMLKDRNYYLERRNNQSWIGGRA